MIAATARLPGETPEELVARIEAQAQRVETPSGAGSMVWHIWGEGEPLVLLHGSFGSWTHWLRNIDALSRQYRVIIGDIPGMGDSAEPPRPFTVESLAQVVSDGLDIVLPPPARFHFAGFSFGGIVGGHVAALQVHRLRTYTALGSNGLGLSMGNRDPLAKPSRTMSDAEILDIHRHNLAIQMIADTAKIDDLALHLQATNTRRARIRSGAIPLTDTLAQAMRRLPVPIQGIWGGRDGAAGPFLHERAALFHDIQPGARFHVVPGAGHWVGFESPETVNALLLDFLASHPIENGPAPRA